jgi:MYXO-CTERM domain-containing protein
MLVAPASTPVLGVGRACAASAVHVAVVVDHGAGAAVSAVCVPASARDNGAIVLATRAAQLGVPAPRYNASGLLCSIDGTPATGCGEPHNGKYAYWSYWHGSNGKWTYAETGPASTRVDSEVIEGWRWEPDGAASASDPPPRASTDASRICVTAVVTTTTRVVPRTTTPTTVTVAGTTVAPLVHAPVSAPGSAPVSPPAQSSTTTPTPVQHTTTTTFPPTVLGAGVPVAATHSSSGSDPPTGLIVGIVLVAGLALAGAFVARRRRSASP